VVLASLDGMMVVHIAANLRMVYSTDMGFISGPMGVVTRAIIGIMLKKASGYTRILTALSMKDSGAMGFSMD